MQDARVRAALLVICLACLLGSGIVLLAGRHAAPPPVVITPPPAESDAAPVAAADRAAPRTRDLCGCRRGGPPPLALRPPVRQPRHAGDSSPQAARRPNADLDAVNLAQKVTDGEKVFVPKRGTAPPPVSRPETATFPCPAPAAARPARQSAPKAAKSSHSNKMTADSGEQIALNTATAEQLRAAARRRPEHGRRAFSPTASRQAASEGRRLDAGHGHRPQKVRQNRPVRQAGLSKQV